MNVSIRNNLKYSIIIMVCSLSFTSFSRVSERINPILLTDSYKMTHHAMYPEDFRRDGGKFQFNLAARKPFSSTKQVAIRPARSADGDVANLDVAIQYDHVVFYGLQQMLKKYLEGVFVTQADLVEARKYAASHFGRTDANIDLIFNKDGWQYIIDHHGGRLPLVIKALPEGSIVNINEPGGNVLLTVENTDPKCYWLPGFIETLIVQLWYPMVVATNSNHLRQSIEYYLRETTDLNDLEIAQEALFKLHDFGFRGVSSIESAGIGGAAHLTAFLGTDTQQSLVHANQFYGTPGGNPDLVHGYSIPASEHSVMTSFIKRQADGAVDIKASNQSAISGLLKFVEDTVTSMLAMVVDSYDPERFILEGIQDPVNKDRIKSLATTQGKTFVFRPDSGIPADEVVKTVRHLAKIFGFTKNKKGFIELPSYIRVIQGDGINPQALIGILESLKLNGLSTRNVAFGCGGALLQKGMTRDNFSFAYKANAFTPVGGETIEIFKQPSTDPGKKSKSGMLALVPKPGATTPVEYITLEGKAGLVKQSENRLTPVFIEGNIVKEITFDDVRKNCNEQRKYLNVNRIVSQ